MSDYTPTTEEVRAVWRDAMTETSEYFDALSPAEADKRFNAWLQAHDARIASEAAERALREAAEDCAQAFLDRQHGEVARVAAEAIYSTLRTRADRLRADRIRAERERVDFLDPRWGWSDE